MPGTRCASTGSTLPTCRPRSRSPSADSWTSAVTPDCVAGPVTVGLSCGRRRRRSRLRDYRLPSGLTCERTTTAQRMRSRSRSPTRRAPVTATRCIRARSSLLRTASPSRCSCYPDMGLAEPLRNGTISTAKRLRRLPSRRSPRPTAWSRSRLPLCPRPDPTHCNLVRAPREVGSRRTAKLLSSAPRPRHHPSSRDHHPRRPAADVRM
jgi:hypothetical protein